MRWIAIATFVFVGLAAVATAQEGIQGSDDVIKLKNGQEFIGRVTEEDEASVTILFRGGEIVLPRRRIAEVIRAERREVARADEAQRNLGRYRARAEHYFLYYRGRRVGWRESSFTPRETAQTPGYDVETRTVFFDDNGEVELDRSINEIVDLQLRPVGFQAKRSSDGFHQLVEGAVDAGFLTIRRHGEGDATPSEILFGAEVRLPRALFRELADTVHFPERGGSFKVFDPADQRFIKLSVSRELRKEVVAGRHQYVSVWRFEAGDKRWEIWADGHGGVVREELGGAHMIALRAKADDVRAFAAGDRDVAGASELSLSYEDSLRGFKVLRPNLTWSFEFPSFDSPHAITLLNPTLQASVDVVVLDRVGKETEAETIAMDLLGRLRQSSEDPRIAYQKSGPLGGVDGLRFEVEAERKGMKIRTLGAVGIASNRAYALLLAAPQHRFRQAEDQLERILDSFEIIGSDPRPIAN